MSEIRVVTRLGDEGALMRLYPQFGKLSEERSNKMKKGFARGGDGLRRALALPSLPSLSALPKHARQRYPMQFFGVKCSLMARWL